MSVFYRSDANQKWQFQGETGERLGNLKRVATGSATETMQRVIVVYPYNENYYINTETYNVEATLPATQHYLADSYGLDGNIMISSGEYNQFSLKNVCGWLKVQLTGEGEKVQRITLKGNNGEQVAEQIYINSSDATSTLASEMGSVDDAENGAGGNLIFEDTILTEVTLDCGEGIILGAEPTAFYIALPPQTFEKGLTVEIVTTEDKRMIKSTDKSLTIGRNTIQPMAAITYRETIPSNQIWYTATEKITTYKAGSFNALTISNVWDSATNKGVITCDAAITEIKDYAFAYTKNLISIQIPDSVVSIGNSAFNQCSDLTSVILSNNITTIGDSLFNYCSKLMDIDIPDNVTKIEQYAFGKCQSLTNITLPDNLVEIGNRAFAECTSLKKFNGKFAADNGRSLIKDGVLLTYAETSGTEYMIPAEVTTIGPSAFYYCRSLTNVVIPNGVTKIDISAFEGCRMPSITLPESVTSIESRAFFSCSLLASVYCKSTTPPSIWKYYPGSFDYNASERKFYVPASDDDSIINAYKRAWSDYADYIEEYDFSAEQQN